MQSANSGIEDLINDVERLEDDAEIVKRNLQAEEEIILHMGKCRRMPFFIDIEDMVNGSRDYSKYQDVHTHMMRFMQSAR